MELLLMLSAAFLAFSNGANDNFKGFATVWGSETLSYRRALTTATVATVLGSLLSVVLAESLLKKFSGNGLVPSGIAGSPAFILNVGLAAACTVATATRLGLPVSTTHALIGALVGAGVAHGRGIVDFANLSSSLLAPLLLSPVLAAALGYVANRVLARRTSRGDCACAVLQPAIVEAGESAVTTVSASVPQVIINTDAHCDSYETPIARVRVSSTRDRLHILSAASICFARGVNDTPKLAALLVAARSFNPRMSILAVAVLMAAGGLAFSRAVARTMSRRLVKVDHAQGLSANLISASLILFASRFGMPVSTTQVLVGSLAGVGFGSQSINWTTLRVILLAWVATLPLAAVLSYMITLVLR